METITLEQMYYIGEIIGVIVVIASLLYVGRQLQQNVEALQASQRQTTMSSDIQYLLKIVEIPNLALLRTKAELTDEEKIQLYYMLSSYLRMRELDWIQYQKGALDETTWAAYQSTIKSIFSTPNARAVWQNISQFAMDSFVAHVNSLIADEPVNERIQPLRAFDQF